jgi:hypothetical protein
MQTRVEALTLFPRALKAANEELVSVVTPSENTIERRAAGWDPYEVWRTRVKAPQNSIRLPRNR